MRFIVAASGPSLTPEVAELCKGNKIIAVSDAYLLLPFADYLYACDAVWWDEKRPVFAGEKWSSHDPWSNEKRECAKRHGLRLIDGNSGQGFSFKKGLIHYGANSGFQAVNLALQFGATDIVMVGFDMRSVDGKSHFFGEHQRLRNPTPDFAIFIKHFEKAAKLLPEGIRIVNATPGSALTCFPL
jgi:hypothetical protein